VELPFGGELRAGPPGALFLVGRITLVLFSPFPWVSSCPLQDKGEASDFGFDGFL